MKKINIHLISDSTGETLGAMSRAVMSQFKGVESKEYMWSLVRTQAKLHEVMKKVEEERGIVLYTILSHELLDILLEECRKYNIIAVAALDQVTEQFSKFVGQDVINKPGRQHVLDKEYFARIEAINYTISHDDGQKPEEIDEADMVLVGPSRTSKSPTCVYLSHRGYKAANIPFVSGVQMPEMLFKTKKPLIVGLTINSDTLIQIRKNRMKFLSQDVNKRNDYIDFEAVDREIKEAKKMYMENRWPILEVSKKSIEETAAAIMQKFNERKK